VQVDIARREITLKLVYYGPALSGKTSNLQALHRALPEDFRGRLMSLETRDDRTLFFDLLPVQVEAGSGLRIKLKVYTVPGQVFHNATRRLVLQAADGVAFVADSRVSEIQSNADSFHDMVENLRANGLDPGSIPLVIRSDAEIDEMARRGREPVYKSIATEGKGVIETFLGLLGVTWSRLEAQHQFRERFGVDARQLLLRVASRLRLPKSTIPPAPGDSRPGGEEGG
jgi:signal recognition particle receptor subunit beta